MRCETRLRPVGVGCTNAQLRFAPGQLPPVNAFWSISVYNDKGYFEPNPQNAYTLNNLTAKADADGSISIQFGGCDSKVENCLPTPPGGIPKKNDQALR